MAITKLSSYRLDQELLDVIENLKKELGIKTNTDVILKALSLQKAVSDNQKNNGSLILRLNGVDREVVFV